VHRRLKEIIGRENAAQEKRLWLKIADACNNRCLFCLDADQRANRFFPIKQLQDEIERGRAEGCQRLILSGGEPTLHPDFLELVTFGNSCGYRWIQVITNGRRFAYAAFAREASLRGLNEATLSIHGHCPELHDRLVEVPGAFSQALAGLKNLLQIGLVVSVDIVISAFNLEHLPQILDFFISLGVREFDLLWLVPFGNAWKNRKILFPDESLAASLLQQALELARSRKAVVWTNRLPARLLEGFEELVQDPYKLHDEARGRKELFINWYQKGRPPACREPERCRLCPLEGFCLALEEVCRQQLQGRFSCLRLSAAERRPEALEMARLAKALQLVVADEEEAELSTKWLDTSRPIALEPLTIGAAHRLSKSQAKNHRLVAGSAEILEELCCYPHLEIVLNADTAGWLSKKRSSLQQATFSLQGFGSLSHTVSLGANPVQALQNLKGKFRLRQLPLCWKKGARPDNFSPPLEIEALLGLAKGEVAPLVDWFIRRRAHTFSLRCNACRLRPDCPGLPLNYLRAFGFQALCHPRGIAQKHELVRE